MINVLDSAAIRAKLAVQRATSTVKDKWSKMNGDSQLVVALVLVAVAIGLCFIFRTQINAIMTTLFGKIDDAIDNLTAGTVG